MLGERSLYLTLHAAFVGKEEDHEAEHTRFCNISRALMMQN
jgi:hypothetical protein